jgi:hypothetical protein
MQCDVCRAELDLEGIKDRGIHLDRGTIGTESLQHLVIRADVVGTGIKVCERSWTGTRSRLRCSILGNHTIWEILGFAYREVIRLGLIWMGGEGSFRGLLWWPRESLTDMRVDGGGGAGAGEQEREEEGSALTFLIGI